jgi:hypothetical protein
MKEMMTQVNPHIWENVKEKRNVTFTFEKYGRG